MNTCIGIKVTNGQVCGIRCKPDKLYCGRHDPTTKKPKTKRSVDRQRLLAAFDLVAKKVGYTPSEEDVSQKIKSKMNRLVLMDQMPAWVSGQMRTAVKKYALACEDLKPLGGAGVTPFPRKIWMMISWYLTPYTKDYENVAMSCKTLYNLFVREKTTWYFHPLKSISSPRLFMFPIFRVVEFMIPEGLDVMLSSHDLPIISDVIKQFKRELGEPKSKFEESQRMGDVIVELSKSLMSKIMEPEDEFIEEIPGAGIFTDLQNIKSVKFNDPGIRVKAYKKGSAFYIIVLPIPGLNVSALESRLNRGLFNFTGKSVIQLMRMI
jgi:hypothetical protein